MLASVSVISFASLVAIGGASADSVKGRTNAAVTKPHAVASSDASGASTTSVSVERASVESAHAEVASMVVATAARQLGTRYRFGGAKPGAFDCSGFVRYVFARHGVELPRTAREQAATGVEVRGGLDSLRTGDLLFFTTRRGRATHVAIYVDGGRIIHASSGSRRVRYDDLRSARGTWFMKNLTGVMRVIGASPPPTEVRRPASREYGPEKIRLPVQSSATGG